ncbi:MULTISPECIES: hypothetical protein [Stenotrophomonas]|uniref:Uncharacterized protein n=2 Tax=Pseudomonadota TaxID=1224 RepID=A0ABU5MFB1_9GAMM|nr:hypothetical protein [Stenotrophomonas muris]MBN5070485.1 hypothetical protein [Stenotrophomonas maltophilia]MDZ7511332.1 hypothetical protein [Stenotrophomonas muris]
MLIKATAFAVGRDFDRPLGSLIQSEGGWFLRAQIKDREDMLDVAVAMSGKELGEIRYLESPSSCVHLADGVRVEFRVLGAIEGPGKPPVGALVWSTDGNEQTITLHGSYLTTAGTESKDFSKERAFYSKSWGAYLVGEDGKDLAREPLFFNEIDKKG